MKIIFGAITKKFTFVKTWIFLYVTILVQER